MESSPDSQRRKSADTGEEESEQSVRLTTEAGTTAPFDTQYSIKRSRLLEDALLHDSEGDGDGTREEPREACDCSTSVSGAWAEE